MPKRIWFMYIFWVGYFLGNFLKLYLADVQRITTKAYCRLANALVGGDRTHQFLEARKKRLTELKEQKRLTARKLIASRMKCAFSFACNTKRSNNPHFVATPHTHQDR
jgi:hypothetical protein